jgi:hypothetical protein
MFSLSLANTGNPLTGSECAIIYFLMRFSQNKIALWSYGEEYEQEKKRKKQLKYNRNQNRVMIRHQMTS